MLCEDVTDEPMALRIAGRLARVFAEPFSLEGDDVHVASASIGVVLRDGAHDDPEELLRDADAAMYRAKERGRARVELFDTGMRARAIGRLQTEGDLRRALERDELRVVYQPIVALGDGRIRGFEALVRWQHPERGLLAPAQFIPVAEESGMIVALGRVVLEEACRQSAQLERPARAGADPRQPLRAPGRRPEPRGFGRARPAHDRRRPGATSCWSSPRARSWSASIRPARRSRACKALGDLADPRRLRDGLLAR